MTEQVKKRFPWGKLVLAFSLALNLLIAGLIAGALLGKGPRDSNPLLRDLGFGPFVQALPTKDKREITREMIGKAGSLRENRRELRREFEAFLVLLRSETLNEASLRDAITRQRSRVSERQEVGQELLIQRILAMTPGARADYADALDKALKRRPKPAKQDR